MSLSREDHERLSFARRSGSASPVNPSRTPVDTLILDFSSGLGSASLAGKIMVDLGYTVLKIEDETGDPLRLQSTEDEMSMFDLVNGSKSSVCVRDAHPHAAEAINALCTGASCVIADQQGWLRLSRVLGANIASRYPKLTICRCTPFGTTGNWADWVGGEEIVQAMSGVMSTTGYPDSGPVAVAGGMLTHASALFASTAIIADLIAKGSGAGRMIDAAMIDAAIAFMTAAFPYYDLHKVPPTGIGNRHTMAAPWNSFRCSNGWLILCAGNDPTWQRLCQAIDRPDLLVHPDFATQEQRVRHIEELETQIQTWTSTHSVEEAERILDQRGVPCGPILPLERVLAHPQFMDRAMLREVDGTLILGGLFQKNGEPLTVRRAKSRLAEGTIDALKACGVDSSTIETWHEAGLFSRVEMPGDAHATAA
jgi:crotonobetainyl-CoA:carnitine CoA-transferase CaiB-like acyl-CoA transferase